MDGTPHLLTDVKFTERRRGYDPEEVDNFLERVSSAVAQLQDKLRQATARAEEADAKVAEAQRAQALAESELARAGNEVTAVGEAPVAPVDPELEAERASKILLMAQRTADATIEDANDTAQQAIADARAKAANLIGEAESEAERLRSEAAREAAELVERQRAAVVKDVKELEEVRSSVQGDVDSLKAHLDEQRARIRRGVEALALVLDDPEGLRVDDAPDLSQRSMTEVIDDSDDASDTTVDVTDDAIAASDDLAAADAHDDEDEADVVVLAENPEVSGVDLTAAPQPARAPGGIFNARTLDAPTGSASASAAAAGDFPAVAVPELLKTDRPDIDLASEDLFEAAERDERVGPPTQPFIPFGESDDPLGPADDEADKAMRAFFETDFDSQAPEQKSRFGFRR
jgi:cell division initiation protein